MGISFDDVEANRKFAEKFDYPFDLLSDPNREVGLSYGACETSTDGYAKRIAYVIDESGKIVKSYADIDAEAFPETVLADISGTA